MKKIGLVTAMHDEFSIIMKVLPNGELTSAFDCPLYIYKDSKYEIYVVQSGIGKVSSALGTELLIDKYGCERIINYGVAGAANASLEVGDAVLGYSYIQHDIDTTAIGDPWGLISAIKRVFITADETLFNEFRALLNKNEIHFKSGVIATADKFVSDEKEKERIIEYFDPMCFDMEAGAAAQVCYMHKIPFVSVKTISDKADSDASVSYATKKTFAIEKLEGILKLYFNKILAA